MINIMIIIILYSCTWCLHQLVDRVATLVGLFVKIEVNDTGMADDSRNLSFIIIFIFQGYFFSSFSIVL